MVNIGTTFIFSTPGYKTHPETELLATPGSQDKPVHYHSTQPLAETLQLIDEKYPIQYQVSSIEEMNSDIGTGPDQEIMVFCHELGESREKESNDIVMFQGVKFNLDMSVNDAAFSLKMPHSMGRLISYLKEV